MLFWGKKKKPPAERAEPTPVLLPEGARLTGLFMHESTSAMTPYYIFRETENGVFMKITSEDPRNFDEKVFAFADKILDNERAGVTEIGDALRRQLEAEIEKYGALLWNGFDKSRLPPPGVCDGDFAFLLYIELSDGTDVNAKGNRAAPEFWMEFRAAVERIFESSVKFGYFD